MKATGARRFGSTAAWIWGGLLAWAAYFLVVYVVAAVACARGFADLRIAGVAIVPLVAACGLVPTLGVTTRLALAARRRAGTGPPRGDAFADFLAWALALLGVLALLWTALPLLLLQTGCA